jgi:predicted phosphodiesterase
MNKMSLAVISDVHSNLEALEAVLDDMEEGGIKKALFLGDAVGYGPNPNECTELLDKSCDVLIAGNHDWAVLGLEDVSFFNPVARAAVLWTETVLTPENRKILEGFPIVKVVRERDLLLVHSSPYEPDRWHYLIGPEDAAGVFGHFKERICMVGHSHAPFIVERDSEGEMVAYHEEVEFREGSRYVINVGSVGQPRDGDPRACYAVMDEEGVRMRRVEYPVRKTQEKMSSEGLPQPLIERLSFGM